MSSEIAIRVEGLSKVYQIYDRPSDRLKQIFSRERRKYYREFWAVNDVSFEINKGETVGIIGRNGSGKSTLLQMICGTLNPTAGSIKTNGRIAALLELGSGFNPEFTGRDNVYLNASILGLGKSEIDESFEEIIRFADIGDFLDQPVKAYSSGMLVRLAFAVAVHVRADILVVDEALSVGDAFFQAKCMSRIKTLMDSGVTVLFVSHDINAVKALCSRALWLNNGQLVQFDTVNLVSKAYAKEWIEYANARVDKNLDSESLKVINNQKDSSGVMPELRYSGRSGSADIRFISYAAYCEKDLVGIDPIEFGKSISIDLEFQVSRPIQNLVIGIHVKDKNNQHLVGFNTGNNKEIYENRFISGEKYKISFSFPLNLQAGRYSITAVASSLEDSCSYSDVVFLDWVEDIGEFIVSAKTSFPLSDCVELEHEILFKKI